MSLHASRHSNLVDLLLARSAPDSIDATAIAFTHLENGETVDDTITFAELDLRVRTLAARLQRMIATRDRVLLVYPPGIDYIIAFFACAYAGAIAVPALPPTNARTLPRLRGIADDCTPRIALAPANVVARMQALQENASVDDTLTRLEWLEADDAQDAPNAWIHPKPQPSDILFLQYTSGSTGMPKGVMVSHANVLANLGHIDDAFGIGRGDTIVSWLPPHHDMGLIGNILYSIYTATRCVLLPPAAFRARPFRWLKALSNYRARFTVAPNFAYDLCVDKTDEAQKRSLNLGALDFALNGSEPVRADTLRRFAAAFAASGLRASACAPVYGLAEATLMVSSGSLTPPDKRVQGVDKAALERGTARVAANGLGIASVGPSARGEHRVAIVDPDSSLQCVEGDIGEIWVHGPSVASGYWGKTEESIRVFSARLAGANDADTYLRTGDLGFVHSGELFVTGRLKDMMIFGGRNVYPHDIERTVERLDPRLRANGCAAFSFHEGDNTELVIVQEVEGRRKIDLDVLIPTLRAAIAEQHDIANIAAVLLIRAGHLPRTSSGKIQHARCKELFFAGAFNIISAWQRDDATEEQRSTQLTGDTTARLANIWAEVLGCEHIPHNEDFFAIGGHSLAAAQVIARVSAEFGVELDLEALFEHPTLSALASEIDIRRHASTQVVERVDITTTDEASFSQQRLWFLDRLDPNASIAYNLPVCLRLRGKLNVSAMRRALDRIVERHDSLRTVFDDVAGRVCTRLRTDTAFSLVEHDLRGASSAEVRAAMQDEVNARFDLSAGPLIRGCLLRVGDDTSFLLITLHHIVGDGWSLGVLLREFATLYTAFDQHRSDPLQALPIQYTHHAAWQRASRDTDVHREQLAYWRAQLVDAPALLQLPTNRPRPSTQSYRGGRVRFVLSAADGDSLRALAQRNGVTLFMTLLGGWSTLLARLSGQIELVVGTTAANRQRVESEALIGFFVNTLALRIDLSANPSVGEFLRGIKRIVLDAQANQNTPFDHVVDAVHPQRTLSHHPIFQALLSLNLTNHGALALPGVETSLSDVAHDFSPFDISLLLADEGKGREIAGHIEFATDLFDSDTIERWARHLVTLLRAMVADDRAAIGTLPLLESGERQRLLTDFNANTAPLPQDALIHQYVEHHAAQSPDATAIICGEMSLTYAELNRRANRLAHQLINLGVLPDARVALCLDRSPDLIVAILAVLKAGGAYVPLDPAYPPERLAYMLDDSAPVALVTQQSLCERLPQTTVTTVMLDAMFFSKGLRDSNPDPRVLGLMPNNLAYVIYTSGSAGLPKGAMIEHRHLLASTLARDVMYAPSAGDRFLMVSSIAFDSSVAAIFMTLGSGGALSIAPQDALRDPPAICQLARQHEITALLCVPSLAQLLFAGGAWGDTLRTLIVAGEPCPPALVQSVATTLPKATLYNEYGPTEATVWASVHRCEPSARTTIPIGRPIANATLYILDSRGEPVPIGVTGEIYIGGAGVARGYLNRPELTAERFLADPFHGGRMYKTGDLGRWLPDGSVEYLGRNDFQVKIRGFRIELGEIEAKLCAIGGVREAVVLARDDGADKRLVAYVVSDAPLEVAALRSRLAAELPEHMLPSAFVALAAFPLTPNGKLDRKALPEPGTPVQERHRSIAPRNATEAAIATIWTELLGLDHVGIHDNFFDFGGHSLKAATATFRINNRIGANQISLVDFYRTPTIEALAARIDTHETESDILQQLTRAYGDNKLALICCPYAGASAAVFQPLAEQLAQRGMLIEVYALTIPGNEVGMKADASQSVESIASACVERILGSITGTIALYGHCVGSYLALEITRQLELAGREVQFLAVGGAFPATRFGRLLLRQDLWGAKGDREIHALIQSWGGPSDAIDDDMLRFMTDNFRRDSRMAAQYERRRKRWRIAAPIHCIVGTNDKLTSGYQKHYQRWGDISENVSLETIADAEHYFVGTHPEKVATILSAAVERVLVKTLSFFSEK